MDTGQTNFEILEANYWEHYKFAKELAMFYPVDHPKRLLIEAEINKLIKKINRNELK